MTLEPYDDDANCRACGHVEITTQYHSSKWDCTYNCGTDVPNQSRVTDRKDAHIFRRCQRCGFKWLERPLNMEGGVED
jgi:predicted RNA-binding Zn-ribbon protein involved in translation (DUF1610 family)